MPEEISGIPLNVLLAIIIILVVLVFAASYMLGQKDAAERILSLIGGILRSFSR